MALVDTLASLSIPKLLIASAGLAALMHFTLDEGQQLDAQIKTAREEEQTDKNLLLSVKRAQKDVDRILDEMKVTAAQFSQAIKYLPNDMNQSELMRLISEEAKSAGVKVNSVQPQQEAATRTEFYQSMGIEVEIEGSFNQVATFLASIAKLPRIMSVSKMRMDALEVTTEYSMIRFTGVLLGFRYVPEGKT